MPAEWRDDLDAREKSYLGIGGRTRVRAHVAGKNTQSEAVTFPFRTSIQHEKRTSARGCFRRFVKASRCDYDLGKLEKSTRFESCNHTGRDHVFLVVG